MLSFASSSFRDSRRSVLAATVLVAVATTAIVSMWSTDRTAFADARILELRSTSFVGPVSGGALAPAERLNPPVAAVPLPVVEAPVAQSSSAVVPAAAVFANRSTCRRDLPGSLMTITIPDISYSCPVYSGGQSMLNSGAATLITDEAIRRVLADHPGGPGLLWVAGHRTSHGGAFAAVPNLADGSLITLTDGQFTATYRVVGRLYVTIKNDRVVDASGRATGEATLDSIIRPDHGGNGASRLLLQTCDGDSHRWMIYADLVTG